MRDKIHPLPGGRVGETDLFRMQAQPLEGVGPGAVLLVAGDRMARLAAVDAELIFAAGLWLETEEGSVFVGLDNLVMG